MHQAHNPLVSVIVLNYNGRRFLENCLGSLQRATYRPVELILVDNASSDDSVAFVQARYPDVRIVPSDRNLGYTGGNNLGIRAAQGRYVLLLNNDVAVDAGWLEPLVAAAEQDASIGALQPKLNSMINEGYFEYAGASGGFIDRYGYAFLRGRIFDTMERDTGQYDDDRDIFWASGAALFLRKAALDAVGLLDEMFFMHFEEIDLCWRLHLAGYRVRVIPRSKVWHYVAASLPPESFNKLYWNHRNNLAAMIKNLAAPRLLRILPVRLVLDWAAALRDLLRGQPKRLAAVCKAHGWIIGHARLLYRRRREVQRSRQRSDEALDPLIYPHSLAVDYFLKKKKDFRNLNFDRQHT